MITITKHQEIVDDVEKETKIHIEIFRRNMLMEKYLYDMVFLTLSEARELRDELIKKLDK